MTDKETLENLQTSILEAMIDLCNAIDTYYIGEDETVFERLAHLHAIAGGDVEVLESIFPEYF